MVVPKVFALVVLRAVLKADSRVVQKVEIWAAQMVASMAFSWAGTLVVLKVALKADCSAVAKVVPRAV